MSPHDQRRLALAEWYAREAILHDVMGQHGLSADALETACEYLSALFGRPIRASAADEIIALCCSYADAP